MWPEISKGFFKSLVVVYVCWSSVLMHMIVFCVNRPESERQVGSFLPLLGSAETPGGCELTPEFLKAPRSS